MARALTSPRSTSAAVAKPPFGRSKHRVVMDPVTDEYFSLSRIHPNGDRHHQGATGVPEALVDVGVEPEPARYPVELGDGGAVKLGVEL